MHDKEPKRAIELSNQALKINDKLKSLKFNFLIYRNLSMAYFNAENFSAAQENGLKALKFATISGNNQYIGEAYNCIANSYLYTEQNEKARFNYRLAIKYLNKTNSAYGKAASNNNIAITFDNTQEYDSSLKYYFIANKLY